MIIKDVCKLYNISADTLRYYEKVGVIPTVHRTQGGIRNYTDEDLEWVKMAICFRDAGMPVEMLTEYVSLYQKGDETLEARYNLLKEAREKIKEEMKKYQNALIKMDYKISKYEEALKTGVLSWEEESCPKE